MDCNSKLFLEFSLLYDIIRNENKSLKFRLDNSDDFDKSTDDLNNVTFAQVLYTITKGLDNKELLDMTDEEMTLHIQKLQLKEKENGN